MPTLVKGAIFPLVFVGSLMAFDALMRAGVDAGLALLAMTVANMALIAILEIIVPLRRDWSWWRDGQSINDLVHGALLSIVGPRLGEAVLAGSIGIAAAFLASQAPGGVWPAAWPLWAQVLLAAVISDFSDWAKHWGYHNVAPLWPIHALHHGVDRMHVFKAGRLHFLEAAIRFAVLSAPLIVLGAGGDVILWYAAVMNVLGNLNHSNVDMPMPGFVHYVFATPAVHRLHHEIDADLGRSNLAPGTMLPDLLFGTFRHPHRHPLQSVGTEANPIPGNLLVQLGSPLIWPILVRHKRRFKPKPASN